MCAACTFQWGVKSPFCDHLFDFNKYGYAAKFHLLLHNMRLFRNILQEVAVVELGCVVSFHLLKRPKYLFDDTVNFYSVYVQGCWKICVDTTTSCFWSAVHPAFHYNQISSFLPLFCLKHGVSDCFSDSIIKLVWPFVHRKHHAAF